MNKIHITLKHIVAIILSYISPKTLCNIYYHNKCKKDIDWKNPKDLNEIINWLKFYGDTSDWARLADKFQVREYAKERGCEDYLVPLYGVWKRVEEIDFDSLPNSFVIKTNHGCGGNILCKDKTKLDLKHSRKLLNQWLKEEYGRATGEFHYGQIKPLIIAEEYLVEEENTFSSSIIDYKMWCLNGKLMYIWAVYDRTSKGIKCEVHDREWKYRPDCSNFDHHYQDGLGKVPRPLNLERMIEVAETLAKGHPQMRVDLYSIGEKIYLGEITMTSQGGYMNYFSMPCLLEMGREARKGIKKLQLK